MPQAASPYLHQYEVLPGQGMAAEVAWTFGLDEGNAVTPQGCQQSVPANPTLRSERPVALSKTDHLLLQMLRLQRYARVLPGLWRESLPHFEERAFEIGRAHVLNSSHRSLSRMPSSA